MGEVHPFGEGHGSGTQQSSSFCCHGTRPLHQQNPGNPLSHPPFGRSCNICLLNSCSAGWGRPCPCPQGCCSPYLRGGGGLGAGRAEAGGGPGSGREGEDRQRQDEPSTPRWCVASVPEGPPTHSPAGERWAEQRAAGGGHWGFLASQALSGHLGCTVDTPPSWNTQGCGGL